MSSLLVPCSYGPTPVQSIVVDLDDDGSVYVDLSRVTEDGARHFAMTPSEARALATALLHYAKEAG